MLVFLPSWLGDTAMATPALRLLRDALPRSTIVGLARKGIDELLAGNEILDDVILADRTAVLGPAKVAARLSTFRFDAAAAPSKLVFRGHHGAPRGDSHSYGL